MGRESGPSLETGTASESSTATKKIDPSVASAAILRAYRSDEQLWVWCDHEQVWHRHGLGDGHRSAHCRCDLSPYVDSGYVLVEHGVLTEEILARLPEASYLGGCRPGNCQQVRDTIRHAARYPMLLPAPSTPLDVARSVARGYADPTYVEHLDHRPLQSALELAAYDVDIDGPLTVRRWRGAWMQWVGSHWRELDVESLRADLYELLGSAKFAKRKPNVTPDPSLEFDSAAYVAVPWNPNRRSVGEVLAALEGVVRLPARTEPQSWLSEQHLSSQLVACRNGLLDVATHEVHDHHPDWFNLVAVPFDYQPLAPPPARWLAFLSQLWPDDPAAIASLQEWFGYVLSGRTDLQKLLLIVGPPRSGKGTIVRVLQELVGRGNYAGPTLAHLGTNFGLQELIGKSLAVVADARLGGRDTHVIVERLLSISGEDTLTLDRKYLNPWSGRLPTRVMILSNELPHFGDASGAIATRFVVLSLQTSWLGRENIDLERELKTELPGILLWALQGLVRLTEQRRFTEPASAVEAVLAMHDSASPTSAFLRDRCDVGPGLEVTTTELFAAWRGWCLENSRDRPGNEQTFGRILRSVLPAVRLARPRDSSGRQIRTWQGLALRRVETRLSPMSSQISPQYPIQGVQS